jgi:hypothetical protein
LSRAPRRHRPSRQWRAASPPQSPLQRQTRDERSTHAPHLLPPTAVLVELADGDAAERQVVGGVEDVIDAEINPGRVDAVTGAQIEKRVLVGRQLVAGAVDLRLVGNGNDLGRRSSWAVDSVDERCSPSLPTAPTTASTPSKLLSIALLLTVPVSTMSCPRKPGAAHVGVVGDGGADRCGVIVVVAAVEARDLAGDVDGLAGGAANSGGGELAITVPAMLSPPWLTGVMPLTVVNAPTPAGVM